MDSIINRMINLLEDFYYFKDLIEGGIKVAVEQGDHQSEAQLRLLRQTLENDCINAAHDIHSDLIQQQLNE